MSKAVVLCPPNQLKTLVSTAGADVGVDDVALINGKVTIAMADLSAGADGEFIYVASEIEHAKAAVAITEGDAAYWDNTAKVFTNVATANTLCGLFRLAQLSGDADANIALNQ